MQNLGNNYVKKCKIYCLVGFIEWQTINNCPLLSTFSTFQTSLTLLINSGMTELCKNQIMLILYKYILQVCVKRYISIKLLEGQIQIFWHAGTLQHVHGASDEAQWQPWWEKRIAKCHSRRRFWVPLSKWFWNGRNTLSIHLAMQLWIMWLPQCHTVALDWWNIIRTTHAN